MKFDRVYRGTDDTQAGGTDDTQAGGADTQAVGTDTQAGGTDTQAGGAGDQPVEGVSEHPAVSFLAELEAKLETVGEELKAEALALIAKVREVL